MASPTSQTQPTTTGASTPAPSVAVPMPGVALPPLDPILGALYLGSTIAAILYGIICLQMFLYTTSPRTKMDSRWFKSYVVFILLVDTVQQAMMMASIYRFLVSSFANPLALGDGGPGSGAVFTCAQGISSSIVLLFCQLFLSWRVWRFCAFSIKKVYRYTTTLLTLSLSITSFCASMVFEATALNGGTSLGLSTPAYHTSYQIFISCRIAFDVIVTVTMTLGLYRSRLDVTEARTNRIITMLIIFTVNTNLVTTILSISELTTFMSLPTTTVYGGIEYLTPKTYFNTFLAILNCREFIRGELSDGPGSISSLPSFRFAQGSISRNSIGIGNRKKNS
ncbi:hypothetical protein K435DRAFT_780522, partial [Dendrothele bispora CBS 962.96]